MNNKEKETKKAKTMIERLREWRSQGVEFGFKNYGYGYFAKGVPASYFYRRGRI